MVKSLSGVFAAICLRMNRGCEKNSIFDTIWQRNGHVETHEIVFTIFCKICFTKVINLPHYSATRHKPALSLTPWTPATYNLVHTKALRSHTHNISNRIKPSVTDIFITHQQSCGRYCFSYVYLQGMGGPHVIITSLYRTPSQPDPGRPDMGHQDTPALPPPDMGHQDTPALPTSRHGTWGSPGPTCPSDSPGMLSC